MFDNTANGKTLHINLNSSSINLILRTMLTDDLRKEYGNGFRILVYSSGKLSKLFAILV